MNAALFQLHVGRADDGAPAGLFFLEEGGRVGAAAAHRLGALQQEFLAQFGRAKSLPELHFGIGIHGGEVVAGIMGAGSLYKFTVTGDPINVASA